MTNIIDKLVAIPADKLDDAEAWIGTHCGRDKVVIPIPVQAWARIVFRTKSDGFMWRMGSDGGWSRDGSRAVAVLSDDFKQVAKLVEEAHSDLNRVEVDAWVTHWAIAICEFTNDGAVESFAEALGATILDPE